MEHHGPQTWLVNFPLPLGDPERTYINGALCVFLFISFFSVLANRLIKGRMQQHIVPSPKFSLVGVVDLIIESLHGMIAGTLGHQAEAYFPFIASIFLFVLFGNLLGLLPHSSAPTSSLNTTFALGIASFVYYNVMGVKEHGLVGYMKHFLMGLGIAGLPIAILEMVSHVIRPGSLGIRLFANMFVDHTVVGAFQTLFAWFLPVPLLLFGIVISTIQAFVFATLTAVYVQMATEHEGGHEEGHAH